jgi:hypothetical protein
MIVIFHVGSVHLDKSVSIPQTGSFSRRPTIDRSDELFSRTLLGHHIESETLTVASGSDVTKTRTQFARWHLVAIRGACAQDTISMFSWKNVLKKALSRPQDFEP